MHDTELISLSRLARDPAFVRSGRPAALSTFYRLHKRGKAIPNSGGKRAYLRLTYLPNGTFVRRDDVNAFIGELNSQTRAATHLANNPSSQFLNESGL